MQRVKNTAQSPYGAIGLVVSSYVRSWGYGTGTLIRPNVLLTCAHNIVDDDGNTPKRSAFYRGYNQRLDPEQKPEPTDGVAISAAFIPATYVNLPTPPVLPAWDIALCLLAKPFNESDAFYFKPTNVNELLEQIQQTGSPQIAVDGYPEDEYAEMWTDADGEFGTLYPTEHLLASEYYSACGVSGAPIFTTASGSINQYAVHIRGPGSFFSTENRYALALTDAVMAWINGVLSALSNQNYSPPDTFVVIPPNSGSGKGSPRDRTAAPPPPPGVVPGSTRDAPIRSDDPIHISAPARICIVRGDDVHTFDVGE